MTWIIPPVKGSASNNPCDVIEGPCRCGAWHTQYAAEAAPIGWREKYIYGRWPTYGAPMPPSEMMEDIKAEPEKFAREDSDVGASSATEFTREDLFALHQEMTTAALALMKKKNADYAARSPFDNFKLCEGLGVSAEKGILIRLCDKISRVGSVLEKGAQVKEESITDSCLDILNYAVCLVGLQNERNNRGTK